MATAYVDSSVLLAITLLEPSGPDAISRMKTFDTVVAANLVEAEVRATWARESTDGDTPLLDRLEWTSIDRPLSAEIGRVLAAGYVRGAACWHLATALYLDPTAESLTFLTLDARQRAVAEALGFRT
ncbi:MAG: PIN domain-containing protein [Gemmatimonadaceae bacterium]|nr:PIN domain-containing protein [Gemmatimonadaceae bacterium]